MRLHLGVIDVPYSQAPSPKQRRARGGTKTTGDVAGWLENRYHVMEIFARENEGAIVQALEHSIVGALESFAMGAPPQLDPHGAGTSQIEERFRDFLANKEMDKLGYPGVPTQAAQRGVSHRFKRPYVRRPPRPSFIDTGLYQTSFKAWID